MSCQVDTRIISRTGQDREPVASTRLPPEVHERLEREAEHLRRTTGAKASKATVIRAAVLRQLGLSESE